MPPPLDFSGGNVLVDQDQPSSAPDFSQGNTLVQAPYVIGDSIADGIRSAGRYDGSTKVGASPAAVLRTINGLSDDQVRGRDIVLSTGISNDTSGFGDIPKQIKALKDKGAASVTVLGVGTRPDFAGLNDRLTQFSQQSGVRFVGLDPKNLTPDGVHPTNYGALNTAVSTALDQPLQAPPATAPGIPQPPPTAQATPPQVPAVPGGGLPLGASQQAPGILGTVAPPSPIPQGDDMGAVRHILSAGGQAFGTEPLGLSGKSAAALQQAGIFPQPGGGIQPLRQINEAAIRGLSAAADAAWRGGAASFAMFQAGLYETAKSFGLPEQAARDIAATPEAFLGTPHFGVTPREAVPPGARARIEPEPPAAAPGGRPALPGPPGEPPGAAPTGGPAVPPAEPGGFKPGSVSLEEAGITPAPAAQPKPAVEPAEETQTVAVPQADGTVKQVQVKSGEAPPPAEPPTATPTPVIAAADLRASFSNLTDEQYDALFREASSTVPEVPKDTWAQRMRAAISDRLAKLGGALRPPEGAPARTPLALPAPQTEEDKKKPAGEAPALEGEVIPPEPRAKPSLDFAKGNAPIDIEEEPPAPPKAEAPPAAPEPAKPTQEPTPAPSRTGDFEDLRTAGYDRDPAHPLAGRIEHLKTLAESPDLSPREQRDVQRRIKLFEQFTEETNALPTEQRDKVRSLRPDDIISGKAEDGRTITGSILGFGQGAVEVADANGLRHTIPIGDVQEVRHVGRTRTSAQTPEPAAPAPTPSAPEPAAAPPAADAVGGPWTDTGKKNHLGDAIYENPNGVRAVMENGVPWTESVKPGPNGEWVPKNPDNRKRHHLTTDEAWAGPSPAEKPPAKPEEEKPPPESTKPSEEWTLLGNNEDGLPVYTNPQGVHSVVENGVRDVEPVRLRPTRSGMQVSVPAPGDKAPRYRVPKPKAAEEKPATPPKREETPPAPTEPKPAAEEPAPAEEKPPTTIPEMARLVGEAFKSGGMSSAMQEFARLAKANDLSPEDRQKFSDAARSEMTKAGWQPGVAEPSTAEEKPPVAEPSTADERWWNKELTEYGRKLVLDAAGINRSPKVLWRHWDPETQARLLAAKGAAEEQPPTEAPTEPKATGRPSDDRGNPIFQKGERVVTPEGHHGEVVKADAMTIANMYGGGRETSYHYLIKTDRGRQTFATKLEPETGEPPEVVPDPVYDNRALDPEALSNSIDRDRKDARGALAAAARARLPNRKRSLATRARELQSTASAKEAVLNAWRARYPEEAAKVFGEPAPAEPATVTPSESPAQNIVEHVTKKGKTLRGVVRTDLTLDQAKEIDPYTFRKDGGYFIREDRLPPGKAAAPPAPAEEKPITPYDPELFAQALAHSFPNADMPTFDARTGQRIGSKDALDFLHGWELAAADRPRSLAHTGPMQTGHDSYGWWHAEPPPAEPQPVSDPSEAAPIAGDQEPPEPMAPLPEDDPAVADAMSGAQGKGPVPVTAEPTDKIPGTRVVHTPTPRELGWAEDEIKEPENPEQIDDVYVRLRNGWSPVDISLEPGIDFTPSEIRALAQVWREAGELPEERDRGIQAALRFGDEGTGSEDVQLPDQVREDERAPSGNEPQGPRDVTRPSGAGAQGRPRGGRSGGAGSGGRAGTRRPDRVPDTGEGPEPGTAGRPPQEQAPDTIQGTNFSIGPGDLGEERGRALKARDNVAAIELAKRLTAEKRLATRAEQEVLVKYVGWGGLKNAFRDSEGNFGKGMEDVGRRLEEILTPEEYRTAERSTQYAHYTAEHVIRSMWDAVRAMGFEGGSVFEPGMGIGHFAGLMPADIAEKSTYRGIEMDHLTTNIAKLLYPRSGIRQADYTRMALPEKAFDLVIGNPPFSDAVISSDKKYAANRFMLHDYFFAKSLDAVRPGGLLAFVTSAGTMNKMDPKAREYLAERAEFLGGVRLPSSAFQQSSGTEVTTDILFFKRRPEGQVDLTEQGMPSWTEVVPRSLPNAEGTTTEGNVSRYFSEHPEMVLGQEGFFDKLYKDRYAVHQTPGTDLPTDLRAAVERLPKNVMDAPATPEQKAELDFASTEKKDGSFYVKDGVLMQYSGGAGREVKMRGKGVEGGLTNADRDRVLKLIPIRDALRDVFKADLARDDAAGDKARAELNKAYDSFVKFFGPINKADISFSRPSIVQQERARAEAREEARLNVEPFFEGDFDPTPMIEAKAKWTDIARARETARELAKAEGRPFNEGSFDPDDMPDNVIEKRPNIRAFMLDPESYRLRSIERYNDETGEATKKPIFFENTLKHEEEPQINSAHDGVLWSLNKLGRFDLAAIAEKMGRTQGQIIDELGDAIYKVPGTDQWQTKDEYLSGDVVTKLEEAREAAKTDPEVARNIPALEAAAPQPLPPSRISMVLGMPWIPIDVIQDFVRDHLQLGEPRISYSPAIGTWIVDTNRINERGQKGYNTWSTPRRDAYDLLKDALNRTPPRVYTPGTRLEPPRFDPVATQAAQDKMAAMVNAFFDPEARSGWALQDLDRANRLADIYNTKLNREVLRQFDGTYLSTPGVSSDWRWRPHQTRVVSRIIQTGNTYMAHAVGAGKTSAMIGAGMEMRRLGLVKKPMYVVPNHMLGQFTKEFYEQYPTARIMVADEERFHTHRRRQFVANVAQDDLDAVIITHSGFQKIPISDDFQRDLINEQIDMLMEAMQALDPQQDRITVGRMQKQKEKLEQRLSKAAGTEKDLTLTFEEMGVDFLFVDEAHQFRKLSFATKQGQMKGITPEGSNMAWDLFTKVRYLDSQRPGRSVVFASGTPVTNTMGELYSLSRFIQPQALKERGLEHFDAWAQTFGTTKSTLEETAAGTYAPVTRFGKFVNMPELYKMVGGVMDIVTPSQLEQYVTRPKLKGGQRQYHLAPRSEILDRYQADLARRMEAIKERKGPPQPGDDILLSVINDGRHAAIDPRFVENAQSDETSKLNMMIDNVARIYHATGDVQFYDPGSGYQTPSFRGPATQMIFANLGVNSRGPMGFSGYRWIKEALRRKGVEPDQIAFIGDYKSTLMRQKLFNDMNEGKVRILIGSVQKMGTGVNAQRRLIALHNQDPLWYPADDEQRNGRILRQGNHNPEIEIHDYTTKGTYDSAMWQMMGKKAGFIEQFFRGDPTLRDMEDVGEASMYEQASAMSTTDERILTLTQMKHDLERMRRQESAHESEQWSFRNRRDNHLSSVRFYQEKAASLDKDIAQRQDTKGDKFKMTVGDQTFTKRKDALEAFRAAHNAAYPEMNAGQRRTLGEIGGFKIQLSKFNKGYSTIDLKLNDNRSEQLSSEDTVASAEAVLRGFEESRTNALAWAEKNAKEAKDLEPYLGKRFEGGPEIERLSGEIATLEATLAAEAALKDKQAMRPGTPIEISAEWDGDPHIGTMIGPGPHSSETAKTYLIRIDGRKQPVEINAMHVKAAEQPPQQGEGLAESPPVFGHPAGQIRPFGRAAPAQTSPGERPTSRWPIAHDQITDVPAHTPETAHATAASWVRREGKATGNEHIAVVDNATGRIVHAGTDAKTDFLSFDPGRLREGESVIIHHNHPASGGLSVQDVAMIANPGVTHVTAIGHDGTTHVVSLSDETRGLLEGAPLVSRRAAIAAAYEEARKTILPTFRKMVDDGRLTAAQANLTFHDAISRVLGAAGVVNYVSSRQLPAPVRAFLRDTMKEMGQDAAGIDRRTQSVRPEEAIASLPRPVEGQRAGQIGSRVAGATQMGAGGARAPQRLIEERAPIGGVPLYSAAERAVARLKQDRGTGPQMLAMIEKSAGVKPEEVKWLGLRDWIWGQKSVTKQDVLDYIRANAIDVREVLHGAPVEPPDVTEMRNRFQALSNKADTAGNDDSGLSPAENEEMNRLAGELSQYPNPWLSKDADTKYSSYTLPGGENYRELLLTLPPKAGDFTDLDRQIRELSQWPDRVTLARNPADQPRLNAVLAEWERRIRKEESYKSAHWDEPNILAHVRFDERTAPDGKRVLLVEEVQSDWHQEGRKKGYQTEPPQPMFTVIDNHGNQRGLFATMDEAMAYRRNPTPGIDIGPTNPIRSVGGTPTGVPDAPFKTTWPQLAMKRITKWAVDHGFDRVAWVPGDVQAERYDLSKQIDTIRYSPPDDTYPSGNLQATGRGGGTVIDRAAMPAELPDIIGKEAADKLLQTPLTQQPAATREQFLGNRGGRPFHFLGNADLKVGGEGMKGFYDKILPTEVQKIIGKFGGKIGRSEVDTLEGEGFEMVAGGRSYGTFFGDPETADLAAFARSIGVPVDQLTIQPKPATTQAVHSFDITPEMRRAVQSEGLALFEERRPLGRWGRLRRGR